MTQPTLFSKNPRRLSAARARGRAGAAKAARHAEAVVTREWVRKACVFVLGFAHVKHADKSRFLIEDAREYAEASGFLAPPDKRAWGQVPTALRRRGELRADGYLPSPASNGSPKVAWRLVY